MWPWSKIRALEAEVEDRNREIVRMRTTDFGRRIELHDALVAERARFDALLRETLDLKREGFTPPAAVPVMPQPEALPEVIRDAIRRKAAPGSDLAAVLEGFAREQLSAGIVDDAAIAALARQIDRGQDPELFNV